uniref:WAP domain-containing protein n=1 Tax=Sinocyclocheilus grahami TaxID=75366 RepID=A0A672M2W6_SINGR
IKELTDFYYFFFNYYYSVIMVFLVFCISAKPGVCPIFNLDGAVFIACLELCSHDGKCPNDEKCCSNGCGHQCMPPYKAGDLAVGCSSQPHR